MLRNKKGLELSMTVIVLIILTIIIFISGIALVWKFFAGAEEIKGQIDRNTQQQIESLLIQGNEVVAIPINKKTVRTGTDATFGLGIRNIEADTKDFFVKIDFSGIYDMQGQEYPEIDPDGIETDVEQRWLGGFGQYGPISIQKHEFKIIPLYIRADNQLSQGIFTPKSANVVFNVCVYVDAYGGQECTLGDPSNYNNKVYQVTIETR